MDLNLKDRVALVTGAAVGIGEAIAAVLASEGCRVWLADRDGKAAERAASAISSRGGVARPMVFDVGDPDAIAKAFAQVAKTDGRLDILVNNAGLLSTGPVTESTAQEWENVARVNLSGVLYCAKAAIPLMTVPAQGRIINIASISAMRGGGSIGNVLYGTTKAGVVALTMGLARELGPRGITVNAIAPAVAETPMTHSKLTEELRQRIVARIPMHRLADPTDIANLAAFLASDRASYITGTVIPVDGGILTT